MSKSLGTNLPDAEDTPGVFAAQKKTHVIIRLEENPEIPPVGQFFACNGRSYMLKPGVDAVVPIELVNVLNDAVTAVPQTDPDTLQLIGMREKKRFPYTLVS